LDVLARVVFHLARGGVVEVAKFRRPRRGGDTGLRGPLGDSHQAVFRLIAGGSKPLRFDDHVEYGVRLSTR
jgi:hypothetical protein